MKAKAGRPARTLSPRRPAADHTASGGTTAVPSTRTTNAVDSARSARHRSPPNRNVFVIHGRDEQFREKVFEVLRALDLRPLEWETLVSATRHTAPPLLTVVQTALREAKAIVVLLTPDDVVELHPSLREKHESVVETTPAMQPRPNVLFELGMALMSGADRTIIVEVGELRPVADLSGLNVVRFDGGEAALGKLVQRLKSAGCPVDDSGTDWRNPRRFADVHAYHRSAA